MDLNTQDLQQYGFILIARSDQSRKINKLILDTNPVWDYRALKANQIKWHIMNGP